MRGEVRTGGVSDELDREAPAKPASAEDRKEAEKRVERELAARAERIERKADRDV